MAWRLPPIALDSQRVEFFIPTGLKRCSHRFPQCPDIRCSRNHGHTGACSMTNPDPYYSVYWEVPETTYKGGG